MNILITYTSAQLFDGKFSAMALDQDASKVQWEALLFDAIAEESTNHMGHGDATLVIMENETPVILIDNNPAHPDYGWLRDVEYMIWQAGEWAVLA